MTPKPSTAMNSQEKAKTRLGAKALSKFHLPKSAKNLNDTLIYYRWNLIAVDDGYTFLSYPAIDAFMATVLPDYDVNAEDLDSLFLLHFDEQKGVITLEGTSSLTANLPGLNVPLTVTHEFNVKISNVGTTVIEEKDAMLDLLAAQLSK